MTHDDGTDPALARSLGRMGIAVVAVEEPDALRLRRQRLLPGLSAVAEREFSRRAARRAWAVRIAIAAAALSACVATLWIQSMRRSAVPPQASVLSGEGTVRVEGGGMAIAEVSRVPIVLKDRDRVETLDGRAEVRLVTGASVELEARTRLELLTATRTDDAVDERVALPAGRISVRVPKLREGSHLVIATPNANVSVHGTAFVVDVRPASASASAETRVSVSEGVVSVASGGREVFLRPGATWSSGSAPPPPAVQEEPSQNVAAAVPQAPANPPPAKRSTLSAENELFKAALASRRDGRPADAIALLTTLLAKYPDTPLAAEARAERDRAREALRKPTAP